MMKNKGIAEVFSQIADLLEIMGEQPFRVNSYRRASRTLETLTQDVAELAAAKTLTELQGIGKSTAAKIEEYLTTGSVSLHSELQESVPAGLPLLLNIPGLGPKRIAQAWKELGVENLNDLKQAISGGRPPHPTRTMVRQPLPGLTEDSPAIQWRPDRRFSKIAG